MAGLALGALYVSFSLFIIPFALFFRTFSRFSNEREKPFITYSHLSSRKREDILRQRESFARVDFASNYHHVGLLSIPIGYQKSERKCIYRFPVLIFLVDERPIC